MAKQNWYIPTKTVYMDLDGTEYDSATEARRANDQIKAEFMQSKVKEKIVGQINSLNDDLYDIYEYAEIILSGKLNIKQAKADAEADFREHYNL